MKSSSFTGPKACTAVSDVVFVMDSSGSIGTTDYLNEKDLVKLVAESLDISPNNSRAALVLYSNDASVKVEFDTFDSSREFKIAVDQLPYEKGRTRIDKALKKVHDVVLSKARPDVHVVVIILTDGLQSQDPDTVDLKTASEPLRQKGAHVVAVGVAEADKDELRLMTESDGDVITSRDFGELKQKIHKITDIACNKAGEFSSAISIATKYYCSKLYPLNLNTSFRTVELIS